jgi:flagellar hook-basal body complex protein FliE
MDVKPIDAFPQLAPERVAGGAAGAKDPTSFGKVLKDSLAQVTELQKEADTAITALATGGNVSLHDAMIAVQKADVSFKLMMQVRNKIVEAYQEVLRMSV